MRFKTQFKRNLSLLKRFVGPGTVMSKAGSINRVRSSIVVGWPFCSKLQSLVEGHTVTQQPPTAPAVAESDFFGVGTVTSLSHHLPVEKATVTIILNLLQPTIHLYS